MFKCAVSSIRFMVLLILSVSVAANFALANCSILGWDPQIYVLRVPQPDWSPGSRVENVARWVTAQPNLELVSLSEGEVVVRAKRPRDLLLTENNDIAAVYQGSKKLARLRDMRTSSRLPRYRAEWENLSSVRERVYAVVQLLPPGVYFLKSAEGKVYSLWVEVKLDKSNYNYMGMWDSADHSISMTLYEGYSLIRPTNITFRNPAVMDFTNRRGVIEGSSFDFSRDGFTVSYTVAYSWSDGQFRFKYNSEGFLQSVSPSGRDDGSALQFIGFRPVYVSSAEAFGY